MQMIDLMPPAESRTTLDYWREHRIDAVVWPQAWLKVPPGYAVAWQKTRFTEANRTKVATERGIYAFVVSVENSFIPTHGYIVYIGITGARAKRDLRARYGDYLRDRRLGSKRPRIREMFARWGEHLDFWFAPCPDRALDLEALEKEINTMILPPFVEKDFEPWARPEIKILRTN